MVSFKPQKVLDITDALNQKPPKLHGGYALTEKFDGWDTSIYFDGVKFHKPVSPKGIVIPALAWVAEDMQYCQAPPFILRSVACPENISLPELNDIVNRSGEDYLCKEVVFKVHDVVCLQNNVIAFDRLRLKDNILGGLGKSYLHNVPILLISEYHAALWSMIFERVILSGGAGLVAKRLNSYYLQDGRNSDLVAMKAQP